MRNFVKNRVFCGFSQSFYYLPNKISFLIDERNLIYGLTPVHFHIASLIPMGGAIKKEVKMSLNIFTKSTIIATAGIFVLAGCETTNGNNNALKKGAVGAAAGAVAGAVIGNNAGDGDAQSGALVGAVVGGAAGAYAGCREDGGCGAQKKYPHRYYSQSQNQPNAQINRRQFFDQKTGRYYFYDPVSKREYYENGEPKN